MDTVQSIRGLIAERASRYERRADNWLATVRSLQDRDAKRAAYEEMHRASAIAWELRRTLREIDSE